jgi:hypothetical protein
LLTIDLSIQPDVGFACGTAEQYRNTRDEIGAVGSHPGAGGVIPEMPPSPK